MEEEFLEDKSDQPLPTLDFIADGHSVPAAFVELTAELARARIDRLWWLATDLNPATEREGDKHWRWERVVEELADDPRAICAAVESSGGYIEGAASFVAGVRSLLEPGQRAVYVDRLAAAPRNRPWLTHHPRYRGCGTSLLRLGIWHSMEAGFAGRLLLSSLPSLRTQNYYQARGFQATNITDHGMMIYELPPAAASRLMHGA